MFSAARRRPQFKTVCSSAAGQEGPGEGVPSPAAPRAWVWSGISEARRRVRTPARPAVAPGVFDFFLRALMCGRGRAAAVELTAPSAERHGHGWSGHTGSTLRCWKRLPSGVSLVILHSNLTHPPRAVILGKACLLGCLATCLFLWHREVWEDLLPHRALPGNSGVHRIFLPLCSSFSSYAFIQRSLLAFGGGEGLGAQPW